MKKIKILTLRFNNEIAPYEIPKFRGALVSKLSVDNTLFHNHTGDETYRYSYPLIQYKQIGKKAALICIEQGTESVSELFRMDDRLLRLGEREMELELLNLNANQFVIRVWDSTFRYRLYKWLPLNQENYRRYQELESDAHKQELLQKVLTGNILSFAKGIGLQVEQEIQVRINAMEEPRLIRYKDARLMAFNVEFTSNVFLPNYIGMGKGASHGFGTVKSVQNKEKSESFI